LTFLFSFYDSAFSASLHCAVGTDSPKKRETEKPLETAARSIAIDYLPFVHSSLKMIKLDYGHKVYVVDASHINYVSNPIKAKQLAFT